MDEIILFYLFSYYFDSSFDATISGELTIVI